MKPNANSPWRGWRMSTHSWNDCEPSFAGFTAALTCAAQRATHSPGYALHACLAACISNTPLIRYSAIVQPPDCVQCCAAATTPPPAAETRRRRHKSSVYR